MPVKPHPTDPDKVVYESRKYDLPKSEWVGLTDEEIDNLAEFHGLDFMSYSPFTRAIEAKLKEKNT